MSIKTEPFVVNVGPQHPSTHGVFRMRMVMDGEIIVDMEPVFGYLHRGVEKIGETRTFTGCIPLTDRMDYLSAPANNLALVMAVEKLAGVKVPERAQYIRVIMGELARLASHSMGVGSFLNDLGAMATPLVYMWREREKIVDLLEMTCGQRLTTNYMRLGGVSQDLPDEFMPAVKKFVAEMPRFIDEYDQLIKANEIVLARTRGVGILTRDMALSIGASGPVLRGSGVMWDIRKSDPYAVYDRMEFDIPVGSAGDCYDRYRVKVEEMRQSVRILEQALAQLPPGEVRAKLPHRLRPPVGTAYGRIEAPKGELGFYIVSDGSISPYRLHVRAPSLINLSALREMVRGWKIADAIVTFGSIDICLGEVDR